MVCFFPSSADINFYGKVYQWTNWNTATIYSGQPPDETVFSIEEPVTITYLESYHWNNGEGVSSPGTIALQHYNGTIYGPYPMEGKAGQGGAPNAIWSKIFDASERILPPGTYTVIDSDPETWAHNPLSCNAGIFGISWIYMNNSTRSSDLSSPALCYNEPEPSVISDEKIDLCLESVNISDSIARNLSVLRSTVASLVFCPQLDEMYGEGNCSDDDSSLMEENCSEPYEGWIVYPCEINVILKAFPHLYLEPGKKISGIYYREFAGGNIKPFVIDEETPVFLPDNLTEVSFFEDIHMGDPDCMAYISGDKSPESYLEASILSREIPEIGAAWHGLNWTDHTILDDTMLNRTCQEDNSGLETIPSRADLQGSLWDWNEPWPVSFNPAVSVSPDGITVEFYTYNPMEFERITRFTDYYTPDSYKYISNETILATGDLGVFY